MTAMPIIRQMAIMALYNQDAVHVHITIALHIAIPLHITIPLHVGCALIEEYS